MWATTYMTTWQQFEIIFLIVQPMFLFSATFFPLSSHPEALQWVVRATPLYHGVVLERGLMLGDVGSGLVGSLAYLLVLGGWACGVPGAGSSDSSSPDRTTGSRHYPTTLASPRRPRVGPGPCRWWVSSRLSPRLTGASACRNANPSVEHSFGYLVHRCRHRGVSSTDRRQLRADCRWRLLASDQTSRRDRQRGMVAGGRDPIRLRRSRTWQQDSSVVKAQGGDKDKSLSAALAQIEKQHGKAVLSCAWATTCAPDRVIPTGAIALDVAWASVACLAVGSWRSMDRSRRARRPSRCNAVANAQKAGGIAAFIDAEHALDPEYAAKLGVDIDNLLVSQPDTGEQALEIADMLIRSGSIDIIVIDSVAAPCRAPRSRARWVTATSVSRPA